MIPVGFNLDHLKKVLKKLWHSSRPRKVDVPIWLILNKGLIHLVSEMFLQVWRALFKVKIFSSTWLSIIQVDMPAWHYLRQAGHTRHFTTQTILEEQFVKTLITPWDFWEKWGAHLVKGFAFPPSPNGVLSLVTLKPILKSTHWQKVLVV
jgi:hypothetical protein